MHYNLKDLIDALAAMPPADAPLESLRLGKPWYGLVNSGDYIRGLRVRIILTLEDDQPYAVTSEAYGESEILVPMARAASRLVRELLTQGEIYVEAPSCVFAGSHKMTSVEFGNTDKLDELLHLYQNLSRTHSVDIDACAKLINSNGEFKLMVENTPLNAADWAVENLSAQIKTEALEHAYKNVLRDTMRLQPFLDRYMPPEKMALVKENFERETLERAQMMQQKIGAARGRSAPQEVE